MTVGLLANPKLRQLPRSPSGATPTTSSPRPSLAYPFRDHLPRAAQRVPDTGQPVAARSVQTLAGGTYTIRQMNKSPVPTHNVRAQHGMLVFNKGRRRYRRNQQLAKRIGLRATRLLVFMKEEMGRFGFVTAGGSHPLDCAFHGIGA